MSNEQNAPKTAGATKSAVGKDADFNADFSANDPVERTGADPAGKPADATQAANAAEPTETVEMSEEEVYQELEQRVVDAEQALKDARAKQADGHKEEIAAMAALNAAKAEFVAAYPPLTPAENVKLYIASENAKRAERAGYGAPASRVDAAMTRGNSRGWRRPVRAVAGPDGNLIKNTDGSVAMPRQMQVRPRPVVPSMRPTGGAVQRA
jgi:hypothetical protein